MNGIIACKQAAKEMLVDFNPKRNCGSTLIQDATTFAHSHFEGMQATLQSDKNITIGSQQEIGSEAETYFAKYKGTLRPDISGVDHTGKICSTWYIWC